MWEYRYMVLAHQLLLEYLPMHEVHVHEPMVPPIKWVLARNVTA